MTEKVPIATELPPPYTAEQSGHYPPGQYPPGQPGQYPPGPPGQYPPGQPGQYPPGPPGQYPPGQPGQYPPGPPGQYPPGQPGQYPPGQPGQYPQAQPGQYPPNQGSTVVVAQPVLRTAVVRTVPEQTNWMVPAILACLCCFWPTGICAILAASNANTAAATGDSVLAERKTRTARNLTIMTLCIGVVFIIIMIVLRVILFTNNRY